MKTSVLLLTTLVAAALFTAVLGGPYRGQRLNTDDDQAREQRPGPVECPNSFLLSCNEAGARWCQEYYDCEGGEECCNARDCPPGLGVCSSVYAKIESHDVPLKVKDENLAKEQSPDDDQAREQRPGPVDCPNSFSLACEPGARVCQEYYECPGGEECCNAHFCPPGLGVCSSFFAKIESHDVPLKVKDENLANKEQYRGPVLCHDSRILSCDNPGAERCQDPFQCMEGGGIGVTCCIAFDCPRGVGVCSAV